MTLAFGNSRGCGYFSSTITPEDVAKKDKTLGDVSIYFTYTDFGNVKADDLVVKGDMSIEEDTTKEAPHDMKKDSKYNVKADLDVSAIHTAIEKSASLVVNAKDAYVTVSFTCLFRWLMQRSTIFCLLPMVLQ